MDGPALEKILETIRRVSGLHDQAHRTHPGDAGFFLMLLKCSIALKKCFQLLEEGAMLMVYPGEIEQAAFDKMANEIADILEGAPEHLTDDQKTRLMVVTFALENFTWQLNDVTRIRRGEPPILGRDIFS